MLRIATHKVEAAEEGAGYQNDRGHEYRKSEHHKAGPPTSCGVCASPHVVAIIVAAAN